MKQLYQKEAMRKFFRFMAERHQMFLRRFIKKQTDPPWTENAVLARGYFTNVFRDLDRVTVWGAENILKKWNENPILCLANLIAFRMINWPNTFFSLHDYPYVELNEKSVNRLQSHMLSTRAGGAKVFTSAYIVTNAGRKDEKEVVVCDALRQTVAARHILKQITEARSLQAAFELLHRLSGLGPFMAYEIATDLTYVESLRAHWPDYVSDSFVNIGPGARRGLAELISAPTTGYALDLEAGNNTFTALALALHKNQDELFDEAECSIADRLDIRAVEHSLCEFSKYAKARRGERIKRNYDSKWSTIDRVEVNFVTAYKRLEERLKEKERLARKRK